jgi:hypothetical protein
LLRKFIIIHVTESKVEGNIDVTGRRGGRHKQLLDDLEKRRYWQMKAKALDDTVWKVV